MMQFLVGTLRGRPPVKAAVAMASVFVLSVGSAVAAHRGPHLVLTSVSGSPAKLAPGGTLTVSFTEKNVGTKRARASTTGFYLSASTQPGTGAIHLGATGIKALRPRQTVRGKAIVVVPGNTAAGAYSLVGCANDRAGVKKRAARSCRAASGQVTVVVAPPPPPPPPSCVPTDTPTLTSQDPKCFDGNAARAVFVSTLGDDANPGTMAAPKRTLAAAISAAAAEGQNVYVMKGTFAEVLTVADGVSVFGGYDGSWQRSPSNLTKITGTGSLSVAAVASGIKKPTTLQLLTLAPAAPVQPGASSYGLRGLGSPGLAINHVTVVAAPAVAGATGPARAPGARGGDGVGIHGGSSAAGNTGGDGGAGGYTGGDVGSGADGAPGLSTTPDAWGNSGGPGGPGGAGGNSNFKPGGHGYAGGPGHFGAEGAAAGSGNAAASSGLWLSEPGLDGQPGSAGYGGGGGGGGGADKCFLGWVDSATGGGGGGGGGGGSGGGGGAGGQGGGGSFGIFLINSNGATVTNSSVTASNGGAGGNGGPGGYPGAGGIGAPGFPGGPPMASICQQGPGASGGQGGLGGPGGLGGDGGGGAGGPSIAIYGLTSSAAQGTTVSHGTGGAGGSGSTGTGAAGPAADYLSGT